jgi:hypothetical protein
MKAKTVATRRRFFWQAGAAALSAPLAVSSAYASIGDAEDTEALKARLATLEDVNTIRELHQAYARLINAGAREAAADLFADPREAQIDASIRNLSADRFAEQDFIEIAADRKTAIARIHCTVELETAIGPSCTLVEMARLQGEGFLKQSERRVLESSCVKQDGVWKIARSVYR